MRARIINIPRSLHRQNALRYLTLLLVLSLVWFSSQGQTLDEYLAKGLKNSPFLAGYNNQVKSLAIDSLRILARFKPQVGLAGDLMYPPAIGRFAYDSAITDGGHFAALVRADQPLFYRKIQETQLQISFIQRLTTENNLKLAEIELSETITAQYLAAYAGQSQVQFEKTVLKWLTDQEGSLKQLVESGIYQQTDYLNLKVTISAQKITIKKDYLQFKNDLAIMNLICGIHDTTAVNLASPDIRLRTTFAIYNSPERIQYRIDSLKNVNDKLLIDLNYKPRLGLFADAGFNATTPRRLPYNLGSSIGLSFTMPLYDGKQRNLELKQITLTEDTRKWNQNLFETRYLQKKDQLLDQLTLTEGLIGDIRRQLEDQKHLIDLYKIEVGRGLVRWLEYISVLNNYAQTENSLMQTEISRLQLINQLNYLK